MRRPHLQTKNMKVQDLYENWDELYDDISSDWQDKAQRLQMRRWHKIRRAQTA